MSTNMREWMSFQRLPCKLTIKTLTAARPVDAGRIYIAVSVVRFGYGLDYLWWKASSIRCRVIFDHMVRDRFKTIPDGQAEARSKTQNPSRSKAKQRTNEAEARRQGKQANRPRQANQKQSEPKQPKQEAFGKSSPLKRSSSGRSLAAPAFVSSNPIQHQRHARLDELRARRHPFLPR